MPLLESDAKSLLVLLLVKRTPLLQLGNKRESPTRFGARVVQLGAATELPCERGRGSSTRPLPELPSPLAHTHHLAAQRAASRAASILSSAQPPSHAPQQRESTSITWSTKRGLGRSRHPTGRGLRGQSAVSAPPRATRRGARARRHRTVNSGRWHCVP